jgi:hypothetical protein
MRMGIANLPAPPLRDVRWIGADGREIEELSLDDLGSRYRILFFFQHACPGCHSHGFPTFARLVEQLSGPDVGFAAIQTAFEDFGANTFERIREDQQRYGLRIPFGHAAPESGNSVPRVMADYRTGGTPWFVGIAPDNRVLFDGFQLDAEALIGALRPPIAFSK